MIRRIEFENFMCLKNVGVDLGPLSVFIGPNGSGKSAIFKGLVTLSRLLSGPLRGPKGEFSLEPGVTFDSLVWNGNPGLPIKFRVWFSDDLDEPGYTLELGKGAQGWSVTRERIRTSDGWIEVDDEHSFEHPTEKLGSRILKPPLRGTLRYCVHPFINDSAAQPTIDPILELDDRFGSAWRYRPSANDIASFVPYPTQERKIFVFSNGFGVAKALQDLQGSDREVFQAIENAVCKLYPHVKSLGFDTDWQGVRLSFMTNRSGRPIAAPQESDGVLLATFLFWRLYSGGSGLKICLEEPENGLHPFLLAERFQLLKKFTLFEEGQSAPQLLVATHSPEFLRAVKAHPNELYEEIRLVEFDSQTGTSVRKLTGFREATKLIGKYLDDLHEHWAPLAEGWGSK